jgi:hypothetical protein
MAGAIIMKGTTRWAWRHCWMLGLFVLAAGCGQKYPTEYGEVSGKVMYNGNPLPGGRMTYVTVEGGFSDSTTIDENGNYKIKVPVGEVVFAIDNRTVGDEKFQGPILRRPDSPKPQLLKGTYVPIPKSYYGTKTSKLTYQVTNGPQTHDILMHGQVSGDRDRPRRSWGGGE